MAKNQQLVNIPRDIEDEFYRYQMPVLLAKVEGRGNGIKTVIVNMKQIGEALERPPSYPTKFFGTELGTHTIIDNQGDRYIVSGRHTAETLSKLLDDFIDKFVLCKQCDRNPETVMRILKGEKIELACKACGGRTPVDSTHRFCSYIFKNPPPKETQTGKSVPTEKREQQADKDIPPYSEQDFTGIKDATNIEWSQDTSEKAVKERRKAQLGSSTSLLMEANLNSVENLEQILNQTPRASDMEIIQFVRQIQKKEEWNDSKTIQIIFSCLFTPNILREIRSKAPILELFVTTELLQKMVLFCIEKLCQTDKNLIDQIPHILTGFYECDIIEEEVLLKWHTHPSKRLPPKLSSAIRSKAAPFIKWLKEAEQENVAE